MKTVPRLYRMGFIILVALSASLVPTASAQESPSGLIAYILYTDTNGDGSVEPVGDNGTLWVLDTACTGTPEGCVGANLTGDDTDERDPAWSPDGASIAYSSSEDRNQDGFIDNRDFANLYSITPADGTITRITNSFTLDRAPSWSADGARLTFQSTADIDDDTLLTFNDPPAVNVINSGGGGRTPRTIGTYSVAPMWSPDGSALAFISFAEDAPAGAVITSLFLISPDAGGRIQITDANSFDWKPLVWSPDGTRVAFVTTTDTNGNGAIDKLTDTNSVAVVNRDGGRFTVLAQCDAFPGGMSWSPDGERIAYVYQGALYTVAAAGGVPLQLTGAGFDADAPAWSPDGGYIAFTSNHRLFVMSAAGGTPPVPLTDEGSYAAQPTWAPLPPTEETAEETVEEAPAEAAPAVEETATEEPTPAGLAPADNIPTPTPTPEGRG